MTVRDQIQAAIETLQMLLVDNDKVSAEYKELLNKELPKDPTRVEVQVPALADCDAVAYIEITEDCEPDEDYPKGYKVYLIKL